MTGVHPAEERLDEAVDELVTEPGGHEVAHRHVVVHLGRALVGGPREALGAQHPARGELVEVEGHAHQRARHGPQRAAGPDGRGRAGGVDEPGADLGGQLDALRTAGQHRLGTDVDGEPGDLGAAQLAADLR